MPKKSQRILRYLLILLAVLVVAAIAYRIYQIQMEKRDFAKAEQSIDSLAQQIEQRIGKPTETRKEKTCDRANMKNAKGPLGCDISLDLLYKKLDVNQANTHFLELTDLSSSQIRVGSGATSGKAFKDPALQRGVQTFYQDLPDFSSLRCGLGFSYPSNFENKITTEDENNFIVTISCTGFPTQQLFPLRD